MAADWANMCRRGVFWGDETEKTNCFVLLFEIEEKHDHFTFLNIVMTVKRFE